MTAGLFPTQIICQRSIGQTVDMPGDELLGHLQITTDLCIAHTTVPGDDDGDGPRVVIAIPEKIAENLAGRNGRRWVFFHLPALRFHQYDRRFAMTPGVKFRLLSGGAAIIPEPAIPTGRFPNVKAGIARQFLLLADIKRAAGQTNFAVAVEIAIMFAFYRFHPSPGIDSIQQSL